MVEKGLAITKRLVEAMGGQIGCQSKLGSGSTFWFTFKVSRVDNNAECKATTTSKFNKENKRKNIFPKSKILLVEDNAINQKVGVRLLESFKCQVQVAANGKECLSILKANNEKFDLVLMDCQMPEMDGFEATTRIREWELSAAAFNYHSDDDSSSNSNNNNNKKKNNRSRGRLPIVALTASVTEDYRRKCLGCGMDDFLAKV